MPKRKNEESIEEEPMLDEILPFAEPEVEPMAVEVEPPVVPHKWEGMYLHGEYRGKHFAWYHVVGGKLVPVASSWDLPSDRVVVYPRANELSEMELA